KAIYYSLFFTLGLTITFTVLGIIAGAMGRLFGDAGGFWKYVLPPVIIILGFYLFFSEKITFSVGLSGRFLPKEKALFGAFLSGLFFGILASPCATPVLAVILTFAMVKRDIVYSGGLLLFYAIGHWILVLGAGISAGFAQKVLVSQGLSNFSTYSKKIAGVLLAGVGVYFIILYFL
ncbi:MAG: cytochrome c biogenesis protein CcdA, partial [Desulfobacterota bacterium]|nr:cytochrome c biogenesis protein CcdA [Thermodesulfobacteriota bacterium]